MTSRVFTSLGQAVRLIVGSWISLLQNLTCGKRTHESLLIIGRHWYACLWFHLQSHPCSLVCMFIVESFD